MFSPPLIHYVVVDDVKVPSPPSQFQEFRIEWMALYGTIVTVLQCPTSIVDIVGSLSQRIEARAQGMGRFSIVALPVGRLPTIHLPPFTVIVSTEAADQSARSFCQQHPTPVLHLPTRPTADETGLYSADIEAFRLWHERILRQLDSSDKWAAAEIREVMAQIRRRSRLANTSREDVSAPPLIEASPFTIANDLAILSVGAPWSKSDELTDDPARIARGIERSYHQTRAMRTRHYPRKAYPPGSTELLIVSAGIAQSLPDVIPRSERAYGDDVASQVYREIRRKDAFILLCDAFCTSDARDDKWAAGLINVRMGELESTLLAGAIEAGSQFIPTVPILQSMRGARAPLRALTTAIRRQRSGWRKEVCSHAKRLGDEMSMAIPDFLKNELQSLHGTVKVLSDAPLELARVADRPLCLRHPVVRIPVTPGFLLERFFRLAGPIFLSPSDFKAVLVLRGTLPDDPVFGHIEHFCRRVESDASSVTVKLVDVRSVDEMSHALSNYGGALAVVDAHGFHPDRGPGKLRLGGTSANPLEAVTELKVPPIVFLAACDTHTIDQGQNTVALSFLAAGARTVVGTLGPIESLQSAVLLAELLLAIRELAPRYRGPIRWSELFWMVSCAAHAGEVAMILRNEYKLGLTPQDVELVHTTAMKAVASFQADWLEQVWTLIGTVTRTDIDSVKRMWADSAYVSNSSLFTQLGHADSIFLTSDSWVTAMTSERPRQ